MRIFLAVVAFIIAATICTTCTVKNIQFTQNCKGHLKRAADANTIELAKSELTQALVYAERHNLTSGYTSVIYRTPDEDIAFWYNNIKSSLNELEALPISVAPLERSNMLMKLRETLLDNSEEGTSVTYPSGIQRFPNNVMWALLNTIQIILWIVFAGAIGLSLDDL